MRRTGCANRKGPAKRRRAQLPYTTRPLNEFGKVLNELLDGRGVKEWEDFYDRIDELGGFPSTENTRRSVENATIGGNKTFSMWFWECIVDALESFRPLSHREFQRLRNAAFASSYPRRK